MTSQLYPAIPKTRKNWSWSFSFDSGDAGSNTDDLDVQVVTPGLQIRHPPNSTEDTYL